MNITQGNRLSFQQDFQIDLPPLPKSIPEDMEDLPEIPPHSLGLQSYLKNNRRWSFARHLREFPRHGTGAQYNANYRACLAGLAEGHPSNVVQYLVQQEAIKKGRPEWIAYTQTRDSVLNGHRYLSGGVRAPGRYDVRLPSLKVDYKQIRDIALKGESLASLRESSGNIPDSPEAILSRLYTSGTLLWCSMDRFAGSPTRSLEEWLEQDLSGYQFFVPNPMISPTGLLKDGRISNRCLSNTGPRKFIGIEFDFKSESSREVKSLIDDLGAEGRSVLDINAALHGHLQEFLPLAMIVFSGGKSLHGFYPCDGVSIEKQELFFDYAVTLKADPQLRTRSQPMRLPWGTRAPSGATQDVIYFNQNVLLKP